MKSVTLVVFVVKWVTKEDGSTCVLINNRFLCGCHGFWLPAWCFRGLIINKNGGRGCGELEEVSVSGEECDLETGEGGDEDGEEVGEVRGWREDV